jgi:hypothetical protein
VETVGSREIEAADAMMGTARAAYKTAMERLENIFVKLVV